MVRKITEQKFNKQLNIRTTNHFTNSQTNSI